MTDLLAAFAARSDGVFTRQQALRCGVTPVELRAIVASGHARRLSRGVFAIGAAKETVDEEHAFAARAVSGAYDGRLIASHQSAALLAGLRVHSVNLQQLRFLRDGHGDSLCSRRLRIGRTIREIPRVDLDGVPAVHPAYAVAQIACERGVEAGVVAADSMLRSGAGAREDLWVAERFFAGCRGRARIAPVARLADGSSESAGESILRLVLTSAGIDLVPQYEVLSESGELLGRADFKVDRRRAIIEFDGRSKYTGPAVLWADKLRGDAIGRRNWTVIRVVWADFADRPALIQRIRNEAGTAALD